jgi:hypothetical protein
MFRFPILLACILAAAPSASAQEIKLLGLNGDLWTVDPNSADISFIGLTGLHTHFWNSMAMDSQGRLFAAYGEFFAPYEIYEIDPQTGLATFVVQTNFIGIRAMAFGPGDVLFISNERNAPLSLSPTDLHTLDLATGSTTLIGEVGVHKMHTMEFWGGELWAYALNYGLLKIDTNTAQPTDVNPGFWGPWNATASMCFNSEGALFYLDRYLWMMDSETGVANGVNELSGFGWWADAVFIEGPAAHFSLWLSGVSGGQIGVKVTGATPNSQVGFAWAKGAGGPTPIPAGFPCAGVMMNLNSTMSLLGVTTTDANGKAALGPQFVPSSAVGTIRVQAIDLTTCEISNKVILAY